jgi:hypothetical protein
LFEEVCAVDGDGSFERTGSGADDDGAVFDAHECDAAAGWNFHFKGGCGIADFDLHFEDDAFRELLFGEGGDVDFRKIGVRRGRGGGWGRGGRWRGSVGIFCDFRGFFVRWGGDSGELIPHCGLEAVAEDKGSADADCEEKPFHVRRDT